MSTLIFLGYKDSYEIEDHSWCRCQNADQNKLISRKLSNYDEASQIETNDAIKNNHIFLQIN